MREYYPTLSTAWSESEAPEDAIPALWQQLVEACYDRHLFPVRSRLKNRVYLIEVSAEAEFGTTGVSHVNNFINEAQARARLGREVTLITLPPHSVPYWLSGTALLDASTGEAWRILDSEGQPLELLENTPSLSVEIEAGGGQPYPVLVLPLHLEPL